MKAVGFDQRILLRQLDFAVDHLNRTSINEMHKLLDNFLREDIAGKASRRCAHAIVMKIWWSVPEKHRIIRDYAVSLFPLLKNEEKVFVHWCMTSLAYPFFYEQVNHLGKHLRMADEVRSRVIINEMKRLYGDRRRVEVATSAIFTTVKSWSLIERSKPGVYYLRKQSQIESSDLKQLLIDVLMEYHDTDSLSIEMLNNSAIMFPFDYYLTIGDINYKRFTIVKSISSTIVERNPKIPYSI